MVSSNDFREAMSRLAATVHVVTARHAGHRCGMTVTAVCSLSTDPASLIVCINQSASAYDALMASGRLCVNMLGSHQPELAARFAGQDGVQGEDRFIPGDGWDDSGPAPRLVDAAAAMQCDIVERTAFRTHMILVCAVKEVHLASTPEILLYAARTYGRVAR